MLGGLKDVTRERFDEVVQELVEENAKRLKLAGAAKKKLIAALLEIWKSMEHEEEPTPVKVANKKPASATKKNPRS